MFDRQTVSLWIHTTGEAVVGDYKGQTLEFLPSTVTTWRHWKTQHPQTRVLNVRRGKGARFNLRKTPKSGGISVGQPGNELKLYPLSILQEKRVINDRIGSKPIVVVFDPDSFAFHAYARGELTFRMKDGRLVDQSGREWNRFTGMSGKTELQAMPATPWAISAWKKFYPHGVIYTDE